MRTFRDLSIGRKLTIILMGTSAAAVLLASFALYVMIINQYQQSYQNDLTGLTKVIGENCKAALTFDVPEDAEKVLSSLSNHSSINSAQIYDKYGNLFAAYRRNQAVPAAPSTLNPAGRPAQAAAAGLLEVSQDIFLNNVFAGRILLQDDMQFIHRFRQLSIYSVSVATGIALALAFLLATALQRLISTPITSLATLSQQVTRDQDYSLRASRFGDDEVGHLVDSFNDMLSRIEARSLALQDSEQRFRSVIDQAVDAFFLHDMNGRFIDVNLRACSDLGYTRDELLAMSVEDIDAKTDNGQYPKKFWRDLPMETPLTLEGEYRRKDGTTFPVESRLGLLALGENRFIMLLARDITERREAEIDKIKMETRLQQAQKMESIGTLAGGIAHDFNNILFPILGYTEFAMSKLPEGNEIRGYLEEVLKGVMRAKELVKQILTFSRQEAQALSLVQIHLIVKETTKLLRASIPATIEIRTNIDPHCGYVLANPTQIHQVLMNLCTNAYHAMRETGGILGIALAPYRLDNRETLKDSHLVPGTYLRLEVSDSGYGIEPDTLKRIFEPYFTTKPKGEGTGLGLSVVHGIVTGHGGHITVYSEPGRGTTFHVYLPMAEAEPIMEGAISQAIPFGDESILLVDDEETIVEIIQKMLEELGYQVTAFTSPMAALAKFREQADAFDLVITDMTMPKMTGYQLAQELLESRKETPIIMCTGFSELINEETAKAIGIREYIMKPVAITELANTIRRALRPE